MPSRDAEGAKAADPQPPDWESNNSPSSLAKWPTSHDGFGLGSWHVLALDAHHSAVHSRLADGDPSVDDDVWEVVLLDLVMRMFKERPPTEGLVLLELACVDGDASSSVVVDAHGVRLTLRLIVFEQGEPRRIRDLKEQEVWCAPTAALANPARFEEYLRGWLSALAEVSLDEERAERLMPHDLVFSDVWQLKRPRTAAEFRAAFLMKSRLGRLLRR